MADLPQIIENAEGLKTLYHQGLDETYHSQHGAIEESLHVFIKAGLHYLIDKNPIDPIHIFEMGFGSGLNAILSYLESEKLNLKMIYHAVETNTLPYHLIADLGYENNLDAIVKDVFQRMHESDWEKEIQLSNNFSIAKFKADLNQFVFPQKYDLVYFDAFSPAKQPELWQLPVFQKLFYQMNSGSVLVTYSAKGEVRRNLIAAGFEVEKTAGPLMKRHMLRAIKR